MSIILLVFFCFFFCFFNWKGHFKEGLLLFSGHLVCHLSLAFGSKAIHFSWLGAELLVCCLAHQGSTRVLHLLRFSVSFPAHKVGKLTESTEASFSIHQDGKHAFS